MLYIKDSIGIEWRPHGKSRYKLYLFKCSSCDNTILSRKSAFKKHGGKCQSCSAKITIKCAQEKNRLRPFEARFNIFKKKCQETDLQYEDYLEFTYIKNCHYCEKTLNWIPHDNNPGFWLDRKDNKLGHKKGNLVTCCGVCNFTKTDEFSYEEFLLLAPALKQIRINRGIK